MEKLKVMIVSHYFTHGGQHTILNYLLTREVENVLFVSHPLPDYGVILSHTTVDDYHKGQLKSRIKIRNISLPESLLYIKDFLLTLMIVYKNRNNIEYYIGANAINALPGLLLKNLLQIKCTIYYSHSYVPDRFSSVIKNRIYKFLDDICIKKSDVIWNVSKRLSKIRSMQGVPIGKNFFLPEAIVLPNSSSGNMSFQRHSLVFLGHLAQKTGVDLLIRAMSLVINVVKDAKLDIIGIGEDEKMLKDIVIQQNLSKHIRFLGYVPYKHSLKLMRKYAIGLAPYAPVSDSNMWTADPSKIKAYLSCGLPVIMTRVGEIYLDIKRYGCGSIVDYDVNMMSDAIIKLLSDDDFYYDNRSNVSKILKKYDLKNVHTDIWRKTLCYTRADSK